MTHNISIPHFYAKLRNSHLYQQDDSVTGTTDVVIFGVQSIEGRALTFHILMNNGAMRSRVPIHMLCSKDDAPLHELHYLQLWDCFGNDISVTKFNYLDEMRVQVMFKDKQTQWGSYVMTFDWYNNSSSEEPTQYKCGHFIRLDDGNFTIQPNNRLMWKDMSFTDKPFPERPDWLVDNKKWICEKVAERWVVDESDYYCYDFKKLDNEK